MSMFTTIDSKLYVDIADTPYKQSQGLMFVKSMPDNKGMLFKFDKNQVLNFWGENTFIPLDIAFIDDDGFIKKITKISPMSRSAISSDVPCKMAIEANDNFFKNNRITIGDKIEIVKDEYEGSFITFVKKQERKLSYFDRIANVRKKKAQMEQPTITMPTFTPMSQGNMNDEPVQDDSVPPPQVSIADLGNILEDDIDHQNDIQQQPPTEEVKPQEILPEEDLRNKHFDNIMDAISAAMQVHQVMTIEYTTKFGKHIGTREIEPYGTYLSDPKDDVSRNILVTYDETVGDFRSFRISNISRYTFSEKKYKPRIQLIG